MMIEPVQEPDDLDWDVLLSQIDQGSCVPFLGAGICPSASPIEGAVGEGAAVAPGPAAVDRRAAYAAVAEECARLRQFPLRDKTDLARVAQFYAMQSSSATAKSEIAKLLQVMQSPPASPNEPHRVLASLNLPLYVTTNYNDFMFRALKERGDRNPQREYCRWNDIPASGTLFERDPNPYFDNLEYSVANPVIYHLHGYADRPASLVITEDDYVDFVYNTARDRDRIPQPIRDQMATSSLLLLGYDLADWDFRVVLRSILVPLINKVNQDVQHLAVQVSPGSVVGPEAQIADLHRSLGRFFGNLRIQVFWGTCAQFIAALHQCRSGGAASP